MKLRKLIFTAATVAITIALAGCPNGNDDPGDTGVFEPTIFDLATAAAIPDTWVTSAGAVTMSLVGNTIEITGRTQNWHGIDIPVGFFTGGSSYTLTVSGTIDDGGAGNVQFQIGRNPHNATLAQAFSGLGSTFSDTSLTFTQAVLAAAIAASPAQTHVRLQLQSDGNEEGANTFDFTITALTITRAR